jgi:hypothetical protein
VYSFSFEEISYKAFTWKTKKEIGGDIKNVIHCEAKSGMEIAQDCVQWVVLSLAVFKLWSTTGEFFIYAVIFPQEEEILQFL